MKKVIIALLLLSISVNVFGQEETEEKEKKFSFSGSVDAYYRANFDAPNDENAIAPGTSFANLPGFALGMANVVASYKGAKVGFVADLVFGPRGEDAVFGSPLYQSLKGGIGGSSQIINQLYVYWNVSESVKLTFGNFNTFLGYEVISPVGNFNYSTSYLFSYGPFSHTGLKADFALSEDFSLGLSLMNPTDVTEFNPTGDYHYGAQLGYSGQYINFLGYSNAFQIDYTGGFDLSDAFHLGLNLSYADLDGPTFYGAAIYPQLATSDAFSIGLRAEYFAETEGGAGGIGAYDADGDGNVFEFTLTGSYVIDSLTIKPELRLDSASENAFIDTDLMPNKSMSSFVLAAIYAF